MPNPSAPSSSVQKRARQQLSCTACRNGKLRCDRHSPCDQCLKRNRETSCQYLPPPPKKKQNRNTKDRIAHLEGLVVQLMNRDGGSGNESSPQSHTEHGSSSSDEQMSYSIPSSTLQDSVKETHSSPSDVGNETSAAEFGQLSLSNGNARYKGAAHWEAILEGVRIPTSDANS